MYHPDRPRRSLVERLYRGERSRTLFRKLGQYSVNVYPQQLAALREIGAVQSIDGGALYVLADPRRYDSALGLTLDQTETALLYKIEKPVRQTLTDLSIQINNNYFYPHCL